MKSILQNPNNLKISNTFLIFLSVCILTVLLLAAKPVPVTMQVSVDREDIMIGDTFVVTIEVKNLPGVKLEPFDPAESLGSFEIKDFHLEGPKKRFGRETRVYTYELSTFLSGQYKISQFEISYATPEGKKESIRSPELLIEIKPVIPREGEKDDIRDIKPVMRIPVHTGVIMGLLIIPALIICAWIWFYMQRLRNVRKLSAVYEIQKPPDEIALERLEELKKLNLAEEGKIKQYYSLLSEIIRHYVSRRYGVSVMDKTTLELYKDLRLSAEAKKYSADIKNILSECDLVKFAKYIPERPVIEEDHEGAVALVSKTREIKVAEGEEVEPQKKVS
ncbi:MAG: hypothetical protein ABII23_08255 [bacterium]